MPEPPTTPTQPESEAPPARWRIAFVVLGLLLPWLLAWRSWSAGDLLLTPENVPSAYAAIVGWRVLAAQGVPLFWDQSILGGYPAFALGWGSPLYPGHLPLLASGNPLFAWNTVVLLHLSAAGALAALAANRARVSVPVALALMAAVAGSMDAFFAVNIPAVVFALPWLIWAGSSQRGERPWLLTLTQWTLAIGMCGLIHWTALLLALGLAAIRLRGLALLALPFGLALAAVQLLPLLQGGGALPAADLGLALIAALHPIALLPILALMARDERRWLMVAIPLAIATPFVYPFTWAIAVAYVLALAQWVPLPPQVTWGRTAFAWSIPALILAGGLAAPQTVSLPYAGLASMAGEVRALVPLTDSPKFGIMQAAASAPKPAARYGRPLLAHYFTASPAWPLLVNFAPDPIAATAVALPWHPTWEGLLARLAAAIGPPEETRVREVVKAEYLATAMGLTVLSLPAAPEPIDPEAPKTRQPLANYPFLDFLPVDPAHPALAPPRHAISDVERAEELETDILEQLDEEATLTGEDTGAPIPPDAFVQEPVRRRFYYAARTHAPWAVVLYHPEKPLAMKPAPWPVLLEASVAALQRDTDFPLQPLEERMRYVPVAVAGEETLAILADMGYAAEVAPELQALPDGIKLTFGIEAADTPWLLLRTAFAPGWSCTVNGEARPLAQADGPYLAIPLSERTRNTIALRYRVPGYLTGRTISLVALVLWIACGVIGLYKSGALFAEGEG